MQYLDDEDIPESLDVNEEDIGAEDESIEEEENVIK